MTDPGREPEMKKGNHGGACFTLSLDSKPRRQDALPVEDNPITLELPEEAEDIFVDNDEYVESEDVKRTIYEIFHSEISKFPLLSSEEEKELARRIQEEGDMEAFERFVLGNLRLVIACAKRVKERVGQDQSILSFMDLIQEGIIGLMIAVSRFDYRKNTRFSTYGVPWIYQKMKVALLQHRRGFSVPGYAGISLQNLSEYVQAYKSGNISNLPDEVDVNRIKALARISSATVPIDYSDGHDEVQVISPDLLKNNLGGEGEAEDPEEVLEQKFFREELLKALREELSEEEFDIICRRFGIGKFNNPQKLSDIARFYGKSSEYVRVTINKIINKLRKSAALSSLCSAWE